MVCFAESVRVGSQRPRRALAAQAAHEVHPALGHVEEAINAAKELLELGHRLLASDAAQVAQRPHRLNQSPHAAAYTHHQQPAGAGRALHRLLAVRLVFSVVHQLLKHELKRVAHVVAHEAPDERACDARVEVLGQHGGEPSAAATCQSRRCGVSAWWGAEQKAFPGEAEGSRGRSCRRVEQ
eukprot:scaffold82519_cov37-Phaeocystis_antarctica.AAC.3